MSEPLHTKTCTSCWNSRSENNKGPTTRKLRSWFGHQERVRRLRDRTGVAMTTGEVLNTWSSNGLVRVKRGFLRINERPCASCLQRRMRSCVWRSSRDEASISRNASQRRGFSSGGAQRNAINVRLFVLSSDMALVFSTSLPASRC